MKQRAIKIVTVIGARPQFIKAAVISRAIRSHNNNNPPVYIDEELVHTGQHYDHNMSDVFFEKLQIPKPTINLNIGACGHGEMTGKMISELEKVIIDRQPDWVLVYGDTNSTLAGALAAVKLHIPVAHVEAGLRSYNRRMPEEINRIMTDTISNLLLCPGESAVKTLLAEGIGQTGKPAKKNSTLFDRPAKVHMVGDVMYDSFLFWQNKISLSDMKNSFALPDSFILATLHRQENTDSKETLQNLMETLKELGTKYFPVVLPLHPRTRKCMEKFDIKFPKGIIMLPPVSYDQMVYLLDSCKLVITDSGGLQKEAYFAKKGCVTLRKETEWIETIESGNNILAGNDRELILSSVSKFLTEKSDRKKDDFLPLYGEGNAGAKIVNELITF